MTLMIDIVIGLFYAGFPLKDLSIPQLVSRNHAAVRFHEEHLSSSSSPGKVLQPLEAEGHSDCYSPDFRHSEFLA